MPPMLTLYKLRSLERLDFVADILVAERLYCAPWYELNDPMEGYFDMSCAAKCFGDLSVLISTPQTICCRSADKMRICSLSLDISDIRLWAHYGGAQAGVAIEIDFSGLETEVRKVIYDSRLQKIDVTDGTVPDPREILSHKTHHWSYESEYRVITKEHYFPEKGRIRRVIVGRSCPDSMVDILRRLLPSGARMGRVGLDPSRYLLEPYDLVVTSNTAVLCSQNFLFNFQPLRPPLSPIRALCIRLDIPHLVARLA